MDEYETERIEKQGWESRIRRFLTAQTVSLLGSSLVQYAIVWHITLSTSSGVMMTISTVCGFLPQILISLFAGVWIDRYDRKRMVMLADGVIALATLAAALFFMAGYKSVWLLFAVLLIRSAGTGVQTPAVGALIPQLVPGEKLMRVNGINGTIQSMMMFLSPALAGAVLGAAGIETTFFIDVATAMVGIGITATVAIPGTRAIPAKAPAAHAEVPATGGEGLAGSEAPAAAADMARKSQAESIRQGFRYIKDHGFIRRLLIFQLTVLVLISPSAFLTPLLVSRSFGPEVWRLTFSEMTFSAGAVAGGLLISAWGGFSNRMRTTALAGTAYGVLMLTLGAAPVYPAYLAANFLIGITMPCYNTPLTVLIQERVEPAMHGRMLSFMQIAGSCALPAGMMIFGPLADLLPLRGLFLAAGCLTAAVALRELRACGRKEVYTGFTGS